MEIREKLDTIGISSEQVDKNQVVVKHVKIDGKHCRCMTRRDDSYIVAVTVEDSVYLQETLLAILDSGHLSGIGDMLDDVYALESYKRKG